MNLWPLIKTKIFLPLVLLVLLCHNSNSQALGLQSPSVKWFQINSDTARVIFPSTIQPTGIEVSRLVHEMARNYSALGYTKPPKKIDIILQNATDVTNGYVGFSPYLSEFYLNAPQDNFSLGSIPWHRTLSWHEYRHVQQHSAGRVGISGVISSVLGEAAYNAALHLSVPDWFLEGDAVMAETDLSNQGRGEISGFIDGFREKELRGERWNYSVLRNGSFKKYVPNHYPLGYLLTSYGRNKHGEQFWGNIYKNAMQYESLIYPFSNAIKKESGLDVREFYQEAMDAYASDWRDSVGSGGADFLYVENEGDYRNYSSPWIDENGNILAMIDRFDGQMAIYRLTSEGIKEKLLTPGLMQEPTFTYASGKIAWAEIRRHPRWIREDYSVVMLFDGKNKKQLTHQSHYFMPAISPEGDRIAAVNRSESGGYRLHILDAGSGDILQVLPDNGIDYAGFPIWDGPDAVICASRDREGRMYLTRQVVSTGDVEVLASFDFDLIGKPWVSPEWILFSMNRFPANQVFGYRRSDKRVFQISQGDIALYNPVLLGDTIVATGFTLEGRRLFQYKMDEREFKAISGSTLADRIIRDNGFEGESALPNNYAIKKYPILSHPINFHSLYLDADDPVTTLIFQSTNVLHTVDLDLGYRYNFNDNTHGPYAQLRFGLFYPELVLNYSGRPREQVENNQVFNWFEHTVSAGAAVPLHWIKGLYHYQAVPSIYLQQFATSGDVDFSFSNALGAIQLAHWRSRAYQEPLPRLGQWLRLRYLNDLDTMDISQLLLQTDFTLPSPVRNHAFWFQFDYQKDLEREISFFGDVFDYSRGYTAYPGEDRWRIGLNYHAPILYPDLALLDIVYLKRVGLTAYYDHAETLRETESMSFRSTGLEMTFDIRIFNVEDVKFGVRWAHLLDADPFDEGRVNRIEFFVPFERLGL